MKLTDFIARKAILPTLKSKDKRGAILELVQAMRKSYEGESFSASKIVDAIMKREGIGSTGLGGGVAVPHAKLPGVKGVIGGFGRCASGLDFSAVDGEPVHIVFVILAPPTRHEEYLKALQKVMTTIRRPNYARFLRSAKAAKEIEEIFKEAEEVAPSDDRAMLEERHVTVRNILGLHVRPSTRIAECAGRFRSAIAIVKDGLTVNAKSSIDLLTLAAVVGTPLILRAEGEDAPEAVESLARLIESGFDEDLTPTR